MATLEVSEPMADDKAKTLSVKLHMDVIESARIVAAIRNVSMTDMLSDMLRPDLVRMEREELAKRTAATKQIKPIVKVSTNKPRTTEVAEGFLDDLDLEVNDEDEIDLTDLTGPKAKPSTGGFKPGNTMGKRRPKP